MADRTPALNEQGKTFLSQGMILSEQIIANSATTLGADYTHTLPARIASIQEPFYRDLIVPVCHRTP